MGDNEATNEKKVLCLGESRPQRIRNIEGLDIKLIKPTREGKIEISRDELEEFDLIIINHEYGRGYEIAEQVVRKLPKKRRANMLKNIVIVWPTFRNEFGAVYEKLGLTEFVSQEQLPIYIIQERLGRTLPPEYYGRMIKIE